MFEMIKLDDGTYVPRTWCTVTNPTTSGGESNVDDVDMLCCGNNCDGECNSCIIQKIFNEYSTLTDQTA